MGALAREQAAFLDAILEARGGGMPSPGLEVYRRSVRANLGGALAAAYPVVRRLVGEAFFEAAALHYVEANASRSGDLHEYGGDFATFLVAYPPARGLAYLADVASLEWACHESFHAADAEAFDMAALARVALESLGELRFRLHPATRLVRSAHPIAAIWEANQPGRDGTPARVEGPDHLVVRRERFVVRVQGVEPGEWTLLAAFAAGASLEAASAALAPGIAQRVLADSLARFVREQVICGFTLPVSGA